MPAKSPEIGKNLAAAVAALGLDVEADAFVAVDAAIDELQQVIEKLRQFGATPLGRVPKAPDVLEILSDCKEVFDHALVHCEQAAAVLWTFIPAVAAKADTESKKT